MTEPTHICPSCGEPVDLDNYRMKQCGTRPATNRGGYDYNAPVYRMVHFTCPCVKQGRKATKENKGNE